MITFRMPSGSVPFSLASCLAMNLSITPASPDCPPEVNENKQSTRVARTGLANVFIEMPLAVKMKSHMIQRQKLLEGKLVKMSHVIH